ncbi:Phage capsid family protein [Caballeronia arationis]|uniref:phage major capsid protein n=1 Tax=Caballeronia arationis TaxID=1777142 RepID=UPI00074C0FFA|nr:phage major capsid protein [Caballeronia arationis]SAL06411.1 Phage capsid family protein [Caballeronia arationis]
MTETRYSLPSPYPDRAVLDESRERITGIPFATLGYRYDDFHAYLPTHSYLHVPSQELWPGASVNAKLPPRHLDGAKVKPSLWLDVHRPVMQMVWVPGEPALIENRVMQAAGWHAHTGARIFNLYNPPRLIAGDARKAGPWLDHLHRIYPEDAGHIANWIAHTTQHPGTKINHALLLSGQPGIGKDTLLEPVRAAVGGPYDTLVLALATLYGLGGLSGGAAIGLNPQDWAGLLLLKDDAGNYQTAPFTAAPTSLAGATLAVSNAIPLGSFLLASTPAGAVLANRTGMRVDLSSEEGQNFVTNATTIRCETRLAAVVQNPRLVLTGTLTPTTPLAASSSKSSKSSS